MSNCTECYKCCFSQNCYLNKKINNIIKNSINDIEEKLNKIIDEKLNFLSISKDSFILNKDDNIWEFKINENQKTGKATLVGLKK